MQLQEKINRNEFLKKLGFAGASLLALYTLEACTNEEGDEVTPTPAGPLTVDLSEPSNAALTKDGGFIIKNETVVARVSAGKFIAATLVCSHEGNKKITFANNEWFCTVHGARYDQSGKGLNENGKKGLTVYTVTVNGNILTIQ